MTLYQNTWHLLGKLDALKDQPLGKQTLARFRRSPQQEDPRLWGFIFNTVTPESHHEETILYQILQLYALYQQGSSRCLLSQDQSLMMVLKTYRSDAFDRRMTRLFTAPTREDALHQLKQLLKLIKRDQHPFNFAKLAEDLYYFNPQTGLQWAKDYYRYSQKGMEN